MKPRRIVVLDQPVFHLENPVVRDLFTRTLWLKMKGYGSEYPYGVLAIDASDYYGTHLLYCEEQEDGTYHPLMGYKSISLSRTKDFNAIFAPYTIIRTSQAGQFEPQVTERVTSAEKRQIDISYDSSWTMEPALRKDRELANEFRDILTMLCVNYHRDYNIPEWFTCGVVRFKTTTHFEKMGHKAVTDTFPIFSLAGEPTILYYLTQFSDEARFTARRFEKLWNNRLDLMPTQLPSRKKAA